MNVENISFVFILLTMISANSASLTSKNTDQVTSVNQLTPREVNTNVNILNKTQIIFEDVEGFFNEKCIKNNASAAKEALITAYYAKEDLKICVNTHYNHTVILHDIRTAPLGELHMVFNLYCNKWSTLRNCVVNFTSTVQDCMKEGILESLGNFRHVAETLVDFVCFKEGDLIARFFMDRGPECIKSKYDTIHTCYNNTISKYVPEKLFPLPEFKFNASKCDQLTAFWNCTVGSLEFCDDTAAANVVGTMFQSVWEMTSCYKQMDPTRYYHNLGNELFKIKTDNSKMSYEEWVSNLDRPNSLTIIKEYSEVYPDVKKCVVEHNIKIDELSIAVIFSFILLVLVIIVLIFTLSYYIKLYRLLLGKIRKSKSPNMSFIAEHRRNHSA